MPSTTSFVNYIGRNAGWRKSSNIGTYIAGFISQLSLALSSDKKGSLDLDAVCNSLLSLMILVESLGCILLKKNLLLLESWRFLKLILKWQAVLKFNYSYEAEWDCRKKKPHYPWYDKNHAQRKIKIVRVFLGGSSCIHNLFVQLVPYKKCQDHDIQGGVEWL